MNFFKLLFDLYLLKRNCRKNVDEIQKLQNKKLRKLLCFAYKNSEYYREKFAERGLTEKELKTVPVAALPVLDKNILMENFDRLITVKDVTQEDMRKFDMQDRGSEVLNGKYHVVHSSGSTGTPCYFLYDENAWVTMLTGIIRAALWNMSMPQILKLLAGKPRIAYIAAADGRYGGAMAVGGGINGLHAQSLFLDIKTPLDKWKKEITEFKPNIIIGYPSAVKILAELCGREKIQLDVIRVISCGEPLGANLRSFIEAAFGAPVFNFYGSSEALALGVEEDPDDGMYLFDDMNLFEITDSGVYITCLYNFAQPLIRYKLTDILMPKSGGNFPFTVVQSIIGRDEDVLWFSDGSHTEFLHPLSIEGICVPGLRYYQFRQLSEDSVEVLAETDKGVDAFDVKLKLMTEIRMILCEKQLDYVQVIVKIVGEILPDTRTGKKKLIISDIQKGA